jgi:hypothetical protein
MIFVFPNNKKYEKELQGYNRLFAFPSTPVNNNKLIILDSGAFGLSVQNKKMSNEHMEKLNEHYIKNYKQNFMCASPDEFLNPLQSMYNFKKWLDLGYFDKISPVLQCKINKIIDLKDLLEQSKFYAQYSKTNKWFFSNPGLTAEQAGEQNIKEFIFFIKEKFKIERVHNLGSGWSLQDILEYKKMNCFDSIDSISWYNTKNIKEFGSLNPAENIKSIERIINEN